MDAAAITDTRTVAYEMQSRAQRGLVWAIGLSLALHLAVLTVQVGGDSFGWRAPTAEALQDSTARLKARLMPREAPAAPAPEVAARPSEPRPSDAPKTATVTVNASSPIPRAEELDPPIPRVETPAALPPTPQTAPTPTVELKPERPAPTTQTPELVTPTKAEPKAPAPTAAAPTPVPVVPPPVADPAPPKPEVKEAVEAPAPREPAAPTPAPVPAPAAAAPAAPAATAQPATPVLAQPSPAPSAAPAAAPASSAAPAASAAPSGASAPASASSASPAAGSPFGASGRPSAVVTLPSPGAGSSTGSPSSGATGSEKLPAFDLPPGKQEGFDPYKARSAVARDVARELNNQRSRVPPSVAPSLSERERLARDVENAIRPDCSETGKQTGLFNIPSIVGGVLLDKGCKIR